MNGFLDISTSGLVAQRTRLEVAAANISNLHSLTNAAGEYEPYRRRAALLGTGDPATGSDLGVHVADIEIDQGQLPKRYEPGSRFADKDGYVAYPNVNLVTEQMNAMGAARAYEANITAIEATKSMISITLQMIA